MTFAERLESLRGGKGWSEKRLAEESGVPLGALHSYGLKAGPSQRKPPFAAVVKIAAALGVTCEAFAACADVAGEPAPAAKPRRSATKRPAAKKPARRPK